MRLCRPLFLYFCSRKSDDDKRYRMIKAALFDMDGVLVDNRDVHIEAFGIFCDRYGVKDWRTKMTSMFGMGNDDIMRAVIPAEIVAARGVRVLGAEKEAVYREIYAPTIQPVRGLRRFLAALCGAGLKCAVGSSGCAENVEFVLERCDIGRYFAERVSGDMVTRCKPDPEIYLTAAGLLGVRPSECVVFEDAKAGIEAARRAGMKVVAVATTLTREVLETETDADMVVDDFTQTDVERIKNLQLCGADCLP